MIDIKLARQIGARGESREMSIQGLWSEVAIRSEKIKFAVQGPFGRLTIEHAISAPKELPSQTIGNKITEFVREHTGITVKAYRDAKPRIIIGQDNLPLIRTHEYREIENSGLVASRGPFG